jgi:hypothetical protein
MSLAKNEEKSLIYFLRGALRGNVYLKDSKNLTYSRMIGFGLSYYLTDILKKLKDSDVKGKWIDDVEWERFDLFPPNKIQGSGKLWWGFRRDTSSELFPEDFYCELEIVSSGKKKSLLHLFRFQIEGRSYELKKGHFRRKNFSL